MIPRAGGGSKGDREEEGGVKLEVTVTPAGAVPFGIISSIPHSWKGPTRKQSLPVEQRGRGFGTLSSKLSHVSQQKSLPASCPRQLALGSGGQEVEQEVREERGMILKRGTGFRRRMGAQKQPKYLFLKTSDICDQCWIS